jgi:hypothetical protein
MEITWAKTLDHVFAVSYTNNSLADKLERMWVVWQKPWLELKELAIANQSIESALLLFFSLRIFVEKIIFLGIFL